MISSTSGKRRSVTAGRFSVWRDEIVPQQPVAQLVPHANLGPERIFRQENAYGLCGIYHQTLLDWWSVQ
jgi:hypothetical protein